MGDYAKAQTTRADRTNRVAANPPAPSAVSQDSDDRQRQIGLAGMLERGQPDPRSLAPRDIRGLQRTIGNHATGQVLASLRPATLPSVQTKITVGAADDPNERVADQMADRGLSAPSVQRRVAGSRAISPVIQRVAIKLIAGLDKDTPSTYDVGGGHSYVDHGAKTTETQQKARLTTGKAPSGRVSKVPRGKGASKFESDDKQKQAFVIAYAAIVEKNKNKPGPQLTGAANIIDLAGAGPIYYRDDTEATGGRVQLDIPGGTEIRINSMYPVE